MSSSCTRSKRGDSTSRRPPAEFQHGRADSPREAHLLVVLVFAAVSFALPSPVAADRGALTLELGGTVHYGQAAPSVGDGTSVTGTLVGAWGGVRYGLTNRLELEAVGFWEAPATFVHDRVTVPTASGGVTGALTEEISRWGGALGVRYVVSGLVWRLPVGVDLGWAHTRARSRDLLDTSDPRGATSFGLALGDGSADQLLVAPFAGIEWLASDHLRVSVIPRLELLAGNGSTLGVVVPVTVGWSFYFL